MENHQLIEELTVKRVAQLYWHKTKADHIYRYNGPTICRMYGKSKIHMNKIKYSIYALFVTLKVYKIKLYVGEKGGFESTL